MPTVRSLLNELAFNSGDHDEDVRSALLALRAAREALKAIETLACQTVSGSHPEDLPEAAPLDNEHVVCIVRDALALLR